MTTRNLALALALIPLAAAVTLAPTADAQSECRDYIHRGPVFVTAQYCIGVPPYVTVFACSEFPQNNVVTNTVNHVVGCHYVALP